MARDGQWNMCEEFCKAFNIHYENCVEYAGDVFLKSKKTTQALLAYNKARVCSDGFNTRNLVTIIIFRFLQSKLHLNWQCIAKMVHSCNYVPWH